MVVARPFLSGIGLKRWVATWPEAKTVRDGRIRPLQGEGPQIQSGRCRGRLLATGSARSPSPVEVAVRALPGRRQRRPGRLPSPVAGFGCPGGGGPSCRSCAEAGGVGGQIRVVLQRRAAAAVLALKTGAGARRDVLRRLRSMCGCSVCNGPWWRGPSLTATARCGCRRRRRAAGVQARRAWRRQCGGSGGDGQMVVRPAACAVRHHGALVVQHRCRGGMDIMLIHVYGAMASHQRLIVWRLRQ